MLTWLSTWTVTPWLAIAGAALILSPIIIHLLNKRKFKIVDWAAMDFLLDADKRNRRRVRLENLLLLLMRCLAVFLLGLLLAQPFIPNEFASKVLGSAQFEHLFVLDDSLSMQVQTGNQTPFEEAKQRLVKLLDEFSKNRNDDTFTLILTSAPDQRQVNGARVTEQSVGELIETVNALEPTDRAADLPRVLATLEQELKGLPKNVNRVLYVVSDLRQRDWRREGEGEAEVENDPARVVARLSEGLTGVYVVDVGSEDARNLMITEVRPEGVLVAGVISRFDVTVANFGAAEARDLTVRFKAGDALAIERPINRIAPGETASVPFSFTFSGAESNANFGQEVAGGIDPVRVVVEVISTRPADEDRLLADSTAYFPARIVRGIPTLIVDGDPSSNEERSESYYLRRALEPSGPLLSGVDIEIAHESEIETLSLSKYQVIFLCNVYQFSEQARKDLEDWVRRGGGLVIMPGDQVDERYFNEQYFKEGEGLAPLKLVGIQGDETEERWVHFRVENTNHPVLGVFEGQNNPALDMTKVFRWWGATAAEGQLDSLIDVPARFNDPDASIAMAEKKFGAGRVFMTTIPADADWHIWPIYGTYLISMQELVRHMAGDVAGSGVMRVGEPLAQAIELSDYKTDAELKLPNDKKLSLQAREPSAASAAQATDGEGAEEASSTGAASTGPASTGADKEGSASTRGGDSTRWQIVHEDTGKRGFYELTLLRNDGFEEKVLFAANPDPTEGNLARVDLPELRKSLGDGVKIIKGTDSGALATTGAQRELWKYVLLGVVLVLAGEQLFAWSFGLRR
jgi:hypothetical protein